MKALTLRQAKSLAKKFVKEIEQDSKSKAIWWFVGSIAKGNYQPGTSDIDIIILPKERGIYNAKYLIKKIEEFKKYGTVFKKGRHISLIDPVLFFNSDFADSLRTFHLKMNNINDSYIAGFLENVGCFYIKKRYYKKYPKKVSNFPLFSIVVKEDNIDKIALVDLITKHLWRKHKIKFRKYYLKSGNQYNFKITRHKSLKKLIDFLNKQCLLKKTNFEIASTVVNKREKRYKNKYPK